MVKVDVDLSGALKDLNNDQKEFLVKVDRKFKVAGTRIEIYAKANAPFDEGTHRRTIRHNPTARFLTAEVEAQQKYASVLEFGFSGEVDVKAHTRTSTLGNEHDVKAHTRTMNRPPRPHIVPAVKRALQQLISDLEGLKQ